MSSPKSDKRDKAALEALANVAPTPAPAVKKITERGSEDDWEKYDIPTSTTVDPTATSETTEGTTKQKKTAARKGKKAKGKDKRGCCRKLEEDENLFSLCIGALFCGYCWATAAQASSKGGDECCDCCDFF
ncbi:hypothetical protein SEMRO_1590_G284400.1 [Seminavis robusta]|uniref:Uncharacterized protein n=1 Tax=Seminavis robusta TaxID=568900 RepID=A0A9N8EQY8_9STRA|nr:hypothetical protein SEMRO_1590_G284400.1 [Seminavis robusta]|eukprot:Sro1590_g284400.1 n/a (131) ;mRNA; f:1593-1985